MWKVKIDTNTGKVRAGNQDCWLSEAFKYQGTPVILCGVADGMGGHLSGDVASRIAVGELAHSLKSSDRKSSPLEALAQGFRDANRRIYDESLLRDDCAGMGTTLTAALIAGDKLYLGHVGDSRAYIYSEQGLVRLTHDHSLVEELIRQGGISPDDAEKHPQRHMLTRALGIEADAAADFAVVNLSHQQRLLFCTDGLTRLVADRELETMLSTIVDQNQLVSNLMELALERGAPDNVTIMLVCWEGGTE